MRRRTTLWSAVAIGAVGAAFAWPMQGPTLGENSNYALVRSLADGTPRIDRTRFEVGDLTAGDYRSYKGHIYSDKAPGLAFVTVPAYLVLRSLGMRTTGDPTRALWALRLWSVVLPGLLALLIVRSLGEGISPGYGTATAVIVGAATLVLPLATTFYSHVLTGLLVVAAFALVWRGRVYPERLRLPAAAGFLGGFAFATEYPAAIAAATFGVYAILDRPRVRRAAAYCGGLALGVAPLFAYNQWAFGSPTHLSYFGTYFGSELSSGSFTSNLHPSLINLLFTFFAMPGLFVLAPVLVLAVVGLGLLFAKGKRAEAAVISAVVVAFSLYNASLPGIEYDAFTAGPRYLIAIIPLLVIPLALALERWPLTVGALALISTILMSTFTASHVHSGVDPRWFHPLAERAFPLTAASIVGITGWYAILPFFVALAVAAVCAGGLAGPVSRSARDVLPAGLAVLTWALVATLAPNELEGNAVTYRPYGWILAVLGAVGAITVGVRRTGTASCPRRRPAGTS